MPHQTPLIGMLVGGFVFAYLCGMIAVRLRLPPLVGYLLAGVIVGPFTPGFVVDPTLAPELAEVGVILLMFGVGLHFSLKDLLSVKHIAIPGAIVQIAMATLMGMGLAHLLGWSMGAGFLFGLSLSVASTVVLLTALQERQLVDTEHGRIAIGWLIVEDIAMVLALVLIPTLSMALISDAESSTVSSSAIVLAIVLTIAKIVAFIAVMLVGGGKAIPWILERTVRTGSRELFRLAILAIALGVAFGASYVFGVSFALGAFFAGMILGESELSHRAAKESLPLRESFSVLFFVSVGMLFNPQVLLDHPLALLATFAIIFIGKSIAAYAIVRLFRYPTHTGLTIAASLAQIGEFSFILATLGVNLHIFPEMAKDLILAGAILSILFNPLAFYGIGILEKLLTRHASKTLNPEITEEIRLPHSTLKQHAILIGFDRVGKLIAEELRKKSIPFVVIGVTHDQYLDLKKEGVEGLYGNWSQEDFLLAANITEAKWLLVSSSDPIESGQMIELARSYQTDVEIIARAYSDNAIAQLKKYGADHIITGDYPIALGMMEYLSR